MRHRHVPIPARQNLARAVEEKAAWQGFRAAVRLEVWAEDREAGREAALSLARLLEAASPPT